MYVKTSQSKRDFKADPSHSQWKLSVRLDVGSMLKRQLLRLLPIATTDDATPVDAIFLEFGDRPRMSLPSRSEF